MPTATPTHSPETTEPALALPDDLWRAFRRERRMGSSPREAATHALERSAYQKQDTRERLRELLSAREAERGLTLTESEREAEILAEAEGLPETPAEPEEGSLGAIQADARERLETLREQRARLAPEALVDAAAKAEMANLEDEIRAAETALDLVEVARGETGRREREATASAEHAAAVAAEAQAQTLQPQIAKAAQRVDTAAGVFAESVTAFRDLREAQAGALARTPRGAEAVRARQYKPARVSEALSVALRERGVKIEGVVGSARDEPLAATEPTKL